jgi:hypothetical protein
MREPRQIRTRDAAKLAAVQVSDHFRAILECILDENWATPRLIELVTTSDGHLVGRLDGVDVGFLVAKVAEIKKQR